MEEARSWVGRSERADDLCALPLVQRLAALLDRDPAGLRQGDPLPAGWHMILFTPIAPQSRLGPDGHPVLGDFLPPLALPRRMLGGRRTRFHAPVPIGAAVHRVSEITRVEPKQGRSGRLVLVTIQHRIHVGGGDAPAIVEDQDVIYREAASAAPSRAEPAEALPGIEEEQAFHPDEALLFRYSAVTFNAHRIHYDQPYATGVEDYPALVVNGGLTALLLFELFRRVARRDPVATSARNLRPLFCGRPTRLCARRDSDGWALFAVDEQGRMALEARAE